MKFINGLVLAMCLAIELYFQPQKNLISISGIFFLAKYLLLVVFTLRASPSKRDQAKEITPWALFLISLMSILALSPVSAGESSISKVVTLANYLFYSTLFLFSYVSLGTSFGLIPEERTIRKTNAYRITRHPIYYFSVLLVLNFLASNLNLKNIVCFLILALCSTLRAIKEESLLIANADYADYRNKTPFVTPTGLALALPALLALFLNYQKLSTEHSQRTITVYSDVKFYSINPLEFDDWSSIFIANHLLVDLTQGPNIHRTPACRISSDTCTDKTCQRKRIELTCEKLIGCSGEIIDKGIIQQETSSILNKKNWILPGYIECSSRDNVCLEFDAVENTKERLNSIYLRVGWSQFDKSKEKNPFGFGTHCATTGSIVNKSDLIILKSKSDLPSIHFGSSSHKSFDISYSIPSNDQKNIKEININTPIAYYSVSNPKFDYGSLPWNNANTIDLIKKHLVKSDLIFKNEIPFQIVPKGKEIAKDSINFSKRPFIYKLPDYINDCELLENDLNIFWHQQGFQTKAECADLNVTIQDIVLKKKKWDGFLSPLSPGAPYLNSLHDQYFSKNSNDAWVKSKHDSITYSLIGVGRTNMYVNTQKICGIQDNFLGLSNLHLSDFVFCD